MIRLEPKEFFDKYIIGVVEVDHGEGQVIAYDEDALIQGLTQNVREEDPKIDPDDAYTEALEDFEFNIKHGCPLKESPVFVSKRDWERTLEAEE